MAKGLGGIRKSSEGMSGEMAPVRREKINSCETLSQRQKGEEKDGSELGRLLQT